MPAKKTTKAAPKVIDPVDYKAKYQSLVITIKAELAKWKMRQRQLENQGTNMAVNVLTNLLPAD